MSIQTLDSSPKAEFSWDERKEIKCLTFHASFSWVAGVGVSGDGAGVELVDEADSYVDVDVKAMMPRIGAPSSRAVLADIRTWTPVPWDSIKPARVVVAGRDISVGSQPIANSVSLLLVAFMLANS